jgi:hypothetical protein
MFGIDFYPTPPEIVQRMISGVPMRGTVLEPSAGKGNIVDELKMQGLNVIACEIDENLRAILRDKCTLIADDFLTVTRDQVSHISAIIMNPPFSKFEKHILHAWEIAPPGCHVVSLCNWSSIDDRRGYRLNKELDTLINENGSRENLGECFDQAERKTGVTIGMLRLQKPSSDYNTEFSGFFTDEEEEETQNGPGLMPYNVIRDLVQRYIQAVQIFDRQLKTAEELHNTVNLFNGQNLSTGFYCSETNKPVHREDFKKGLQRKAWDYIFNQFDLKKYATRGLKDDINKFIEDQHNVPFTMRNIYQMLSIIIGTTGQRMEKAAVEVFDKLTKHHEDNRHGVAGWKTNSHFLLTKKFILPYVAELGWSGEARLRTYNGYFDYVEDLERVLCWMLNKDYNEVELYHHNDKFTFGQWNDDHEFFKVRLYKKGTGHFEFKDDEVWAKFNGIVAKAKGYPLYEAKKQTKYQDKQTGKTNARPQQKATKEAQILFEFNISS